MHWDSSDYGKPVSVSMDLRMPQFTIEEVIPTTCYERFHLGKKTKNSNVENESMTIIVRWLAGC